MNDSLALETSNDLSNRVEIEKSKVSTSLKSKFENAKLDAIKAALDENHITYDKECNNLKLLKKQLKEDLDEVSYNTCINIINEVEECYEELIGSLLNGSTNSISKFFNRLANNSKSITSSITNTLAMRTAISLAPTVVSKLVLGSVGLLYSSYKLVKGHKNGTIMDEMFVCDKTLQELEITKDEEDKIVDTRFSPEIQEIIRSFLSQNRIKFNDTGYLSLREQIYSLNLEQKKELCNILNSNLGLKVDFKEKIEEAESSFFSRLKRKAKTVTKSAGIAIGGAAAVNSVDPAILSTPINGTIIGSIFSKLCNSKLMGQIIGISGGATSAILEYLPIIGESVENIHAIENLIVAGLGGLGVGFIGCAASQIIKTISKVFNKFKVGKDRKQILKLDAERYYEDNKEELSKMQAELQRESSKTEEVILLDFITSYCDENGIELNGDIKNINQLIAAISKLNSKDKIKLCKFFSLIDTYNKNENRFINGLIKIKNVLFGLGSLGLAGLSVYDILKDGTVLPELSAKLFANVPNNIYLQLPSKININEISKGGATNGSELQSMIENEQIAREHYEKLLEMKSVEKIDKVIIDEAETSGDLSFVERMLNSLHLRWEKSKNSINIMLHKTSVKLNLNDSWAELCATVKKLYNDLVSSGELNFEWQEFDKATNVVEDSQSVIIEQIDRAGIEKYVSGLSDSELVDLAYYYNSNASKDQTHLIIGDVLSTHLGKITSLIEEYNEKMKSILNTSKMIRNTSAVTFGATTLYENSKQTSLNQEESKGKSR